MYPPTYLEWFHQGEWRRIGWEASTPQSAANLREHGARLAASKPGSYRLVQPSVFADAPLHVIHEWRRVA